MMWLWNFLAFPFSLVYWYVFPRSRIEDRSRDYYHKYLDSRAWGFRRLLQRILALGFCHDCWAWRPKPYHIHHKSYRSRKGRSILGREWPWHLSHLCSECHSKPGKHPWQNWN